MKVMNAFPFNVAHELLYVNGGASQKNKHFIVDVGRRHLTRN
jgi:hypothetical protein